MFMFFILVALVCRSVNGNLDELLLKDPSLWPGHMEPFGSKQKTVDVEILEEWPEPTGMFILTFF